MSFRYFIALSMAVCSLLRAADKLGARPLIELARQKPSGLADALRASLGDDPINKGVAFAGDGPNFIWALQSDARPTLYVDDGLAGELTSAGGNVWFYVGIQEPGKVHSFYYLVNGER